VDPLALSLVLVSAFLHAVWNLLLKRAKDQTAFVWWYLLVPMVLFLPVVAVQSHGEWGLPVRSLACGSVSGVLQAACLLAMAWAYRGGDLSAVYPLSRGSAQVFVVALGVGVLGERLSALGFGGLALVFVGVYVVFLPSLSRADLVRPLRLLGERHARAALGAGVCIALYHLTDRVGVQGANPFQYILLLFAADFAAYTGFLLCGTAARRRGEEGGSAQGHSRGRLRHSVRALRDRLWAEWRANKAAITAAGCISLASYLLVLYALSRERVAYVGPARNAGIVFSVLLGAVVLREANPPMRLLGSGLIVAGLALAGAGG